MKRIKSTIRKEEDRSIRQSYARGGRLRPGIFSFSHLTGEKLALFSAKPLALRTIDSLGRGLGHRPLEAIGYMALQNPPTAAFGRILLARFLFAALRSLAAHTAGAKEVDVWLTTQDKPNLLAKQVHEALLIVNNPTETASKAKMLWQRCPPRQLLPTFGEQAGWEADVAWQLMPHLSGEEESLKIKVTDLV